MSDADNQLGQALAEMINKANAGVDSATGFLQAQMPDVIQQLLAWKAAESLLISAMALAFLIGGNYGAYRWFKFGWSKYVEAGEFSGWDAGAIIPAFVAAIASTVLGLCAFNITWLQIWIAPKVYLIEYAADLVR